MIVKSLNLKSFRNFKDEIFVPCQGVNVIYGDNAQGKTNLLEALWLFTGSKSFRSSKDLELIPIKSQDNFAELSLSFFGKKREQTMQIKIKDGKKQAILNDIEKSSVSKLTGEFLSVCFFPDDLSLIKDSPRERRKFIDSVLSSLYPKYLNYLSDYNKVLSQRNAILKDLRFNSSLLDMLDVYDSQLTVFGSNILFKRNEILKELMEITKEIYTGISEKKEELKYKYVSTIENFREDMSLEEIKSLYEKSLLNSRKQDIASGFTEIGAHRDDIDFFINDLSAKSFGSQGQQRSIVLSLKLAISPLIESKTGEKPVILLDDVMSELDKSRKEYILNHIKDNQIFLTCCDKNDLAGLNQGKSFFIKNGKIEKTEEFI